MRRGIVIVALFVPFVILAAAMVRKQLMETKEQKAEPVGTAAPNNGGHHGEKFEDAFAYMLKNEGDMSEVKGDVGGLTHYGLSKRFLKTLPLEAVDFNRDGVFDDKDIFELTENDAKDLYRKHFWLGGHCDEISNKAIAIKFFDCCVNMGCVQAARLFIRAVETCRAVGGGGISPDGHAAGGGSGSGIKAPSPVLRDLRAAISRLNEKVKADDTVYIYEHAEFQAKLTEILTKFYGEIAKRNPAYKKFLNGWLKRAARWPK